MDFYKTLAIKIISDNTPCDDLFRNVVRNVLDNSRAFSGTHREKIIKKIDEIIVNDKLDIWMGEAMFFDSYIVEIENLIKTEIELGNIKNISEISGYDEDDPFVRRARNKRALARFAYRRTVWELYNYVLNNL